MDNYEKQRQDLLTNTENMSGFELRNYLKEQFYVQNNVSHHIAMEILHKIDDGLFYDNNEPKEYNCEHIVPQLYFNSQYPMRTDLHHIYLCGVRSNSMRNNYKYGDILESDHPKWIINDENFRSYDIPDNPDDYSEYITNKKFEPKKTSRGNVARSCAYFFTMYPQYFDVMVKVIDVYIMNEWNEIDPVNDVDIRRNYAVYDIQLNLNPYILCPELVSKAFI